MPPVRKKTTESTKRHTFSSFRDRVDSIKIEPIRSLTKRPYDYTETSHFLTTLEHWKEINLSGNFTEFLDNVEIHSQSLPQIIHHQKLIYDCLHDSIKKNDVYSIQPLLELLSQFIHDLGPDFLVFYQQTLTLLTDLVLQVNPNDFQNNRNTSNVLEWAFNSLTFTFKYLSRYLTQDLKPTFTALLPILKLTKKTYISRFCAEALSFLIRKSNSESLKEIIELTLYDQDLTDPYCESLTTLFSESMKNTKGTFHSKSSLIFATLIEATLNHPSDNSAQPKLIGLICDVILDILHHGTPESCGKFYELVTKYLNELLTKNATTTASLTTSQILSTLAFAESGKKITNWNILLESVDNLISKLQGQVLSSELHESVTYLLVIVFRNSDVGEITKYHKKFLEFIFTTSYGLIFTQSSTTIAPKVLNFGVFKYVQDWIDRLEYDTTQLQQLAYFLEKSDQEFTLPGRIVSNIMEQLTGEDIYWKLLLLSHAKASLDEDTLLKLLELTQDDAEVAALVLQIATENKNKDFQSQVFTIIVDSFDKFYTSAGYIKALTQFVQQSKPQDTSSILTTALKCLYQPNHDTRSNAIDLIMTITESPYLSPISSIEATPLTIASSRDIIHNIRNLALDFQKNVKPTQLDKTIIVNYLFGLLSNKFQPCWNAVNEALPLISSSCKLEIWNLAYELLNVSGDEHSTNDQFLVESDLINWQPRNSRLFNNFESFDRDYLSPYRSINHSIAGLLNKDYSFSSILRPNILQALMTVPNVVDVSKLIPILINQPDEEEEVLWSLKDRNELLNLFTKLKDLRKSPQADDLREYLLNLLSSKNLRVQQLALDVLFTWNNPSINKYKDNLKNLLDETIFRDELSKFLARDSSSTIEDKDLSELMPFVVRILFGRVQGSPRSNSKQGKKFAIINVLPNLKDDDIVAFIQLGANKIGYKEFFEGVVPRASLGLEKSILNKINGFVNLLTQVYETLGSNFANVLQTTINPLVYSLVCAQNRIDTASEDVISDKIARNIRSNGMKCLYELFQLLGASFDWSEYVDVIYANLISPRMASFATENLQQPSSLLNVMTSWINNSNTWIFLNADEFTPTKAVLSLLGHNAKEAVLGKVLDFTVDALERKDNMDEQFFTLLALVVDSLLTNLSNIIEGITSKEIGSKAIKSLLLLISGNYMDDQETKSALIKALVVALNNNQIDLNDKANILISLAALIESYECTAEEILPLYETCSKLFRMFNERNLRETLVGVFIAIGNKFDKFAQVSQLLFGLNAYSTSRLQELDFEKRLEAFRLITEEIYLELDTTQWLPIIYNCLYFINDANELSIRINASYVLRRFIDCYSAKPAAEEAAPYIQILKNVILPNLKVGIRKDNEDIQSEYISVLEHLVHSNHYTELQDMQVLTYDNYDEANFFKNINHIQLHRRQRAIRRMIENASGLSENSIAHYILPMIERYAVSKDEKLMNVALEAMAAIKSLVVLINWNQYKAILKRYVSNLKDHESLKQRVNLIVVASGGLASSVKNQEGSLAQSLPNQEEIDDVILKDVSPAILKVLNVRDDDTIVARAPLAEALSNFTLCISKDKIDSELPKILTNTCQVMRSRSEELRDAIRKTLGKIATTLGPDYLPFIVKELKTALSRGSQIHVLSFSVHYLLQCIASSLIHGSLNEAIDLLMEIIMEDIFGSAGQEKDAEGYTSKMKEVKFKKSFDTVEIIAANISLSQFAHLLDPIKLILKEHVSYKTQLNLDELLRRLSLGLNHNEESSNLEILHLCYEIFTSSNPEDTKKKPVEPTEQEKHFLTNLERKSKVTHKDTSIYQHTMEKLSLELLRTAISRHDNLLTVGNLSGFVPLLDEAIRSENEAVVTSALKILNAIARLPFSEEQQNTFKSCARRSLIIIKESPSTNSDLCQAALKLLATTIRHTPEINLKQSAISYILTRIQPDLEEPQRQSIAFNFLKAVVSQHILIPEIYDLMDTVAKLMIVNHSQEIRAMSRSVYVQFLMEYDQGKGRLEKQFKYLVNNLTYPTEEGRQSVMELVHLIILKAGSDLLHKLASSFFVALSSVLVSDSSAKCREMAGSLISSIFKKLDNEGMANIEKYCTAWMKQNGNSLLKRCGFSVYRLFVTGFGIGKYETLDNIAHENILAVIESAKNSEDNDLQWELLYSALSVFSSIASAIKDKVLEKSYAKIWYALIDVLLFPHSWIRLISSRLISILLSNIDNLEFEVTNREIQMIAFRLIHQLRAPGITEELGLITSKNLVLIAMRWESEETDWEIEDNEDEEEETTSIKANDYLLGKISGIIRQETFQSLVAKKACIKLAAMFIQFTSEERLLQVAETIISSLYNFTDPNYASDEELTGLSLESLDLVKEKIGTSEYTRIYTKLKSQVNVRRMERKAKRAQMSVSVPEIAAKRKLKKHARSREKRKHEKDANGFYKSKKKRVN
ncbi:uncharacterized protein SPAPADRAFT_154380 [Spathaspora passalidarum NRRL Y-27907]|uniref:Uncharacterized protein n=1 Tax=Spathaspora passalidarum (strain NRRL Y-27907 / 11-Y1) TaxID=619300 RepID=G3ARU0_SPAPN|nr:uncharacterized protein SPAPADRAFT_154380 [Spathaspora passalidarum NRRL Y-27907]EGW31357.1 hypothetical protein SPAPADRAFT_154380 [Spathaspora passalidarum NRRL Y-27907]